MALNEIYTLKYEEEKKSPAAAIVLAFIFGPFGTFYANFGAGVVMCLVYLFSLFGSFLGLVFASVVNMFICYFLASEANDKLKAKFLIEQSHEHLENPKSTKLQSTINKSEEVDPISNPEMDKNQTKTVSTENENQDSAKSIIKSAIIAIISISLLGALLFYISSTFFNNPIIVLIGDDYKAVCRQILSNENDDHKYKVFQNLETCNSSNDKITMQQQFDNEIKENIKKINAQKIKKQSY